MRGMIHEC